MALLWRSLNCGGNSVIKVVFFDVDGTLVSHTQKAVPAGTRAALEALKRSGIRCVMATGRPAQELPNLPVADIAFDGYITLNGQTCYDREMNLLASNPIKGAGMERITKMFREKERPMALVDLRGMYINFENEFVRRAMADVSTAVPEIRAYDGADIFQAVIFAERDADAAVAAMLPDCQITRWSSSGIDILPGDGGQVSGIRRYLDHHGIAPEEAMAFGDGDNDKEMLEFVGIGVAMGNGVDTAKEEADYITAHVDDDGVAKALRHFRLIN